MKLTISVPASFFGIVLGISGLGGCWRAASRLWNAPGVIGETLLGIAAVIWAVLLALYIAKWIWRRSEALAEFNHPVQCCFIALVFISTMLMGLAVLPYSRTLAVTLAGIACSTGLAFAVYRTGGLWMGNRDPGTTTPVLYMPTVAGNFVAANLLATLDFLDLAQLLFGAGALAWLALESVLIHRLLTVAPLPPALRPTLGIQIAPAVVGCAAYLAITSGPPDLIAMGLLGYGIVVALVVLRMLPWIMEQPFAASYWAFTFGLTAMAFDAMRMVERGAGESMPTIAMALFAAANVVVGLIAIGSVWLLLRGRLLPSLVPLPS
jgi:tellurite resistance protein